MFSTPAKNSRSEWRAAAAQQLAVDDIYSGVVIGRAKRENAHTDAKLEIDHVHRAADADN
jgi:hypothetical protein